MSDKATLLALAERVEKAGGPDPELDFRVWAALNGVAEITDPAEGHPMTPGKGGRVEGRGPDGGWHLYGWVDPGKVQRNWTPYGGSDAYPKVTASLDAAMTLVGDTIYNVLFLRRVDGCNVAWAAMIVAENGAEFHGGFTLAGKPAALTAAALRARAAQ